VGGKKKGVPGNKSRGAGGRLTFKQTFRQRKTAGRGPFNKKKVIKSPAKREVNDCANYPREKIKRPSTTHCGNQNVKGPG